MKTGFRQAAAMGMALVSAFLAAGRAQAARPAAWSNSPNFR